INVPGDDSNVSSLTDLPSGSQEPSMESLPALVQSLLLQVGELKSRVVDAEGGRSESRSRLVEPHRSVPGRPSTPAQQIHALHSTPLDRPPPPHMTGSKSSAALLSFQRQTGPDKQVVREVLERMGTSIYDVINRIGRDSGSLRSDEAFRASVDPGTAPDVVSTSADPSSTASSDRFIFVRPEYVPSFNGDPLLLERYLTRLNDIIRTGKNEAWVAGVLRSVPLRFEGDAEELHAGLPAEEAASLSSFDALAAAMRVEFPANGSEQRRLARDRVWDPTAEPASTFYFAKLRALRTAFGHDQTDRVLVQDIVDCLPPTFQAMLRLPRSGVRLVDLRVEIGIWEPTWRKIFPQFDIRSSTPASAPVARVIASTPRVTSVSTPGPTPASVPAAPVPVASTQSSSRPLGLAATYDPSRVIPAAGGEKRKYRRPSDNQTIELNRPCARCGQEHFTFEHMHLMPSAHFMDRSEDDDDYPLSAGF
ncbi:hypothetical protein CF328_g9073, partial [Tilletia controversa]